MSSPPPPIIRNGQTDPPKIFDFLDAALHYAPVFLRMIQFLKVTFFLFWFALAVAYNGARHCQKV